MFVANMTDRGWGCAGGYHLLGSVARHRFATIPRRSRFRRVTRLWKKVITDWLEAVTAS
jgi:hypothetical protein